MNDIRNMRTASGNRIDPRLAKGLVSQALRLAQTNLSTLRTANHPESLFNVKARQRFIEKVFQSFGKCGVGMVANRDAYRARGAFLFGHGPAPDWKGISVIGVSLDLDVRATPEFRRNMPVDMASQVIDAFIDQHALQRLAQRRGDRTLGAFLDSLKPIWGWCHIANVTGSEGVFYVPTAEGLICCERGPISDPLPESAREGSSAWARPVCRVITYIDTGSMRPEMLQSWKTLIDAGLHEISPRYPRVSPPSDAECAAFEILRSEGAIWESRRDYARARAERTDRTERFDPQDAEEGGPSGP